MQEQVPINKGNDSLETPEREAAFEACRSEGWAAEYRQYRKNWTEFAKRQVVSEYPLLVDAELADPTLPVPSDANHLHFGKGQTETELELTPGSHRLQLVLGDANHVPHEPPVMSAPITITVE